MCQVTHLNPLYDYLSSRVCLYWYDLVLLCFVIYNIYILYVDSGNHHNTMLFDDLNKCLRANGVLSYDEACLDINNTLSDAVKIFYQYDECHKCEYQNLTILRAHNFTSIVAKTSSPLQMYYTIDGKVDKCRYSSNCYFI